MDQGPRRRAGVLGVLFFGIFFALLVRLYAIQVVGHEEQALRREAQTTGAVRATGTRGVLMDSGGQILAVSVPAESVWANPQAIEDPVAAAKLLSRALPVPFDTLYRRLADRSRKFVWVKRKVSPEEAAAARALQGEPAFKTSRRSPQARMGFQTEFVRRYPHGPLMSHMVGFEGSDPRLSEGSEKSLEAVLAAEEKVFEVRLDGRRGVLDAQAVDVTGKEIRLTVDVHLQKVMEEELDAVAAEYRPQWAVAVAMDPRSGRILGICNRPTFDPNQPARSPADARINRAIVFPYEPGSTLKPFVAAWALDQGLATPETKYYCENGLWVIGSRRLHDHDPYGTLTLAEGIIKSSNIFAAKCGSQTLGRRRTFECMKAFGFGARTEIDLPAEEDGRLFPLAKWTTFTDTSVPMGREISVTPLQLVAAMSAIANGGTLYRPYVVDRVTAADGTIMAENGPQAVRRVIGEKASRQMVEILKRVVTEGTGRKAQVAGIPLAGKTGTTQKIDPATHQYTHHKFISSFVGFAPANDPKICIAVVVDEPQGAYYGGAVAAPVVGRIIERGLVYVR